MTLSPADTLVCDTTQLAVWQSDADYNYNRELIAPEVNIFEWLNRWFGEILQSIFGSQFAEDYSKTILISIAVLLLLLIGWFIYKKIRQYSYVLARMLYLTLWGKIPFMELILPKK